MAKRDFWDRLFPNSQRAWLRGNHTDDIREREEKKKDDYWEDFDDRMDKTFKRGKYKEW